MRRSLVGDGAAPLACGNDLRQVASDLASSSLSALWGLLTRWCETLDAVSAALGCGYGTLVLILMYCLSSCPQGCPQSGENLDTLILAEIISYCQ